jgi:AraC-like DNA-binding protein
VLHPDELHDGRAEGPGLFGYRQIYIDPVRIAAALPALTGRPAPLPFASPVTDDPVLARVVRMAFARAPEPLELDALVLALAEGLLRSSAAGSTGALRCRVDLPAVARGRDYLHSRLAIVQSSEIEAVTGLDRYQFARQFRALYGTSPYRYSVMRRLDVARARLGGAAGPGLPLGGAAGPELAARGAAPLAETAVETGFADQAHFTRTFKAAFGMTPGRYAKLCAARAGHGAAHSS